MVGGGKNLGMVIISMMLLRRLLPTDRKKKGEKNVHSEKKKMRIMPKAKIVYLRHRIKNMFFRPLIFTTSYGNNKRQTVKLVLLSFLKAAKKLLRAGFFIRNPFLFLSNQMR